MLFIIFASIIAISCSAITIRTLVGYSGFSWVTNIAVTILVTFGWFAPILAMIFKRSFPNVYGIVTLSQCLYILFGFAFILFVGLLCRDFIWYLLYYSKKFNIPDPKNISWLNKTNVMVIAFSLLITLYAFYEGYQDPKVKEVNIFSSKISEDFNIVLVTDIHIDQETNEDKLKRIVAKINSLNPDVVLFAGDMVDAELKVLNDKVDILKELSPKLGTYFTSGNHELYNGLVNWIVKFSSLGDKFLFIDNMTVDIPEYNVFIMGVPDTRVMRAHPGLVPNVDKALEVVDNNRYKILMSHAPDFANNLSEGAFDLQVSGHTHGGQIFPFHILAKMENKFLAGLYDVKGTKLYVSRGAGHWGPPLRFLAPSEITLIKVSNSDDQQKDINN